MDAAELITSTNTSSGQGPVSGGGGGGGGRLPDAAAAQAAALIKAAVDEGYMAALTINRTNADALVGNTHARTSSYCIRLTCKWLHSHVALLQQQPRLSIQQAHSVHDSSTCAVASV